MTELLVDQQVSSYADERPSKMFRLDSKSASDDSINPNSLNQKSEKNRERNREHAKRTRLRKKEMIEGMKMRLLELQREASRLEQLVEESNTASILLCLHNTGDQQNAANSSEGSNIAPSNVEADARARLSKGNIIDQLRHNVRAEAARTFRPRYEQQAQLQATHQRSIAIADDVSPRDSSVSAGELLEEHEGLSDEEEGDDGSVPDDNRSSTTGLGSDKKSHDPSDQKRERNRMHAKLTRDRKKLFTSRMQQTIQGLERHVQLLRSRLGAVIPPPASSIPGMPLYHPEGHIAPAAKGRGGVLHPVNGMVLPSNAAMVASAGYPPRGFIPYFAMGGRGMSLPLPMTAVPWPGAATYPILPPGQPMPAYSAPLPSSSTLPFPPLLPSFNKAQSTAATPPPSSSANPSP